MMWFVLDWLFAFLVGSLLAYAVLKKTGGESILPFDFAFWQETWVPGLIGAFAGAALGELITLMMQ